MPAQRPIDYAERGFDPRTGHGASELKPEQNRWLQEYLRDGGIHLNPAQTAWCAAYTNASLGQAGLPKADNPLAAQSLLDWGRPTTDPHRGDVVITGRHDPKETARGLGHAGFFEGIDPKTGEILMLGGNTGDEVNFASAPREQVLGFRRPSLEDDMAMAMRLGDRQDIPAPGQDVSIPSNRPPQNLAEVFGLHTQLPGQSLPPTADPMITAAFGRMRGRRR